MHLHMSVRVHVRISAHVGKFLRRASTEMDGASKRGSFRNEPVSVPALQNSTFRNVACFNVAYSSR